MNLVLEAVGILLVAFLAGAIPFSNIAARRTKGVDLRHVGSGTVSGTSLYRVAGFAPLAAAGVCDVAKGAVGPLLAIDGRPLLAAFAGGVAVCGHNWSPFLRGAGGRGVAPALGALLVNAWPGTIVLLGAMVLGRWANQTAFGGFLGEVALAPVLAVTHGGTGAVAGAAIAVPMLAKRVMGNGRPAEASLRTYGRRLLFDRDDAAVS